MVCLKIVKRSVRRILIGQDEDGPSEDRPKVRPKDMIGQDNDGPSEDRPKVCPKDYHWTKEATCPYDNASNLPSCQTDMIGRERKLVLSYGTLLIGCSDGLIFLKRFLLADLIDLLSASSFDFFVLLVARFYTAIRD